MKQLFFAIAVLCSITLNAQTTENREVTDFNAISVSTGIIAELTQGEINSLSISVSDVKYLPYLKTVVENGTLKIYVEYKEKKMWNKQDKNRKIKAFVTYKAINKLTAGSGAIVNTKNAITSPALALDISSGAQFNGEVKVTDLSADQSSGAISKFTGTAVNTTVDMSSGAVCTANNFTSENAILTASSGAVLKMGVTKMLTAKASSGGTINYKGNPTLDKNTSSGGVVSKM